MKNWQGFTRALIGSLTVDAEIYFGFARLHRASETSFDVYVGNDVASGIGLDIDQALDKIVAEGEKEMRIHVDHEQSVDVIASGYDFTCPACGFENTVSEAPEAVTCAFCANVFVVDQLAEAREQRS